jgi:polysaccharide biosynthesis protein PelB
MSMSDAAPERLRLIPPLQLLGFASLLVLLLVLAFPRESLQSRLLGKREADALAIAYLEAWQRVEPHNVDVLTTLSREYLNGQRTGDAQRLLRALQNSPDPLARQNALLIEIGMAQTALFANRDPALRPRHLAALAVLLQQALSKPWTDGQLEALAESARSGGATPQAAGFYARLATAEAARAPYWWRKSADLRLALGQYDAAASARFAAQAADQSLDDRRRDFIAGLKALQMGNRLPQAMAAAERLPGDLRHDAPTLRFLTGLAMASGRPDLALHYVEALLNADRAQPEPSPSDSAPSGDTAPGDVVPQRAQAAHAAPAEAGPEPEMTAAPAQDFELAWRVYLANRELAGAEQLARRALARGLDPMVWRPRLAQVALWNQDPATALDQDLLMARNSRDEALWAEIDRLAHALNDSRAGLAVSLHRLDLDPGNLKVIDSVVADYEQAGDPERALDFLQARAVGPVRAAVLERRAELALRAGHDDLALATWRGLIAEYGPKPDYTLQVARILYGRTQFAAALAALEPAAARAGSADLDYWRMSAMLGTLLQRDDVVLRAGRRLLAGGARDNESIARLLDAADDRPMALARLAEAAYRHNGDPRTLARAIDGYTRARALSRVGSLLAGLGPDRLADAGQSPDFLLARAEYRRQTGDPVGALDDLHAAMRLAPMRKDVLLALLWMSIDQGRDAELAALMPRYAAEAENHPALISVYAAAWLHLGDPRRALHYYHLESGRRDDPLWLLSYAEALDLAQRPGAAWRLRRQVWRDLLARRVSGPALHQAQTELTAALASLAGGFADGDRALGLWRSALHADAAPSSGDADLQDYVGLPPDTAVPEGVSPVLRDAALAWAQSQQADALERAWLAARYVNWLARPASAELSLALAAQDRATVARIVDTRRGELPVDARIDALSMLGRNADAQSEAFAAAERQGANDSLNASLREQLLGTAQALSGGWRSVRQGGLKFDEFTAAAGLRLDDRQALDFSYDQRNQRSDPQQLPGEPGQDHTVALRYSRATPDDSQRLTLAQRQGWRGVTPVLLEGSWHDARALNFNFAIGSNQNAGETSQLLLAGMKNLARLGAGWHDGRWFGDGRVEYDRFYLQDRSFLGEGYLASLEAGYKFRAEYPDYSLRLVYTHGRYSAYGTPSAASAALLPVGTDFSAAAFMPQTFSQTGLLLSFGTDLPDGYSHAFRPYLEAGPIYDSRSHLGGEVTVGLVGSVFGRDRLALYYLHQDMSAQGSSPVTETGLRYSWFY